MYLEFFGFEQEPFSLTPNTRFLFLSRRHREAIAAISYGVEHRKGFIALTGEIGSGKTTICRAFLNNLDRDGTRVALILNPQLSDLELLQSINAEFGLPATSTSKRELLDALNRFLLEENTKGRNCTLLIDESQRLTPEALEQVRLLSNLETETSKLIQIVLLGQPDLNDVLELPELEQLNQRITVRYHIDPLDFEETCEYVSHRLEVGKPSSPVTFSHEAMQRIFDYSRGIPRKINVLCDRALLIAFVKEQRDVSEETIVEALREVRAPKRKRAATPVLPPASEDEDPIPDSPDTDVVGEQPSHIEGVRRRVRLGMLAGGGTFVTIVLLLLAGYLSVARTPVAKALDPGRGNSGARNATPPARTGASAPTPSASNGAAPAIPARAVANVDATSRATPAPRPSRTPIMRPLATPLAEPEATSAPSLLQPAPTTSVAPVATSTVAAQETPKPTPAPTAIPPATPSPTPSPAPSPTATPAAVPPEQPNWSYDSSGILRNSQPGSSYAAAVLTWVRRTQDRSLNAADLESMRHMTAEELAHLELASGRAPLFLREARIAPSLAAIAASSLPILVQVDNRAEDFGPWAVLAAMNESMVTLLDPRQGELQTDRALLEEHLAGIAILYGDPDQITGLRLLDEGPRVQALHARLRSAGFLTGEAPSTFDTATERAVAAARAAWKIPGGATIDPPLAMRLLGAPAAPPR